jgi:hypothetical protein
MAKRFNEESSIADVLKQFISQNKLEAGIDIVNVRDAWKNVMGNGINNYTTETHYSLCSFVFCCITRRIKLWKR